jgi:heat shock protein HslJ
MRGSSVTVAALGAIMIVLVAYATGCGGGSEADDAAALQEKVWVASEIEGVDSVLPPEQGQASAVFEGTTVAGSGTINRFSASYETGPGNTIQLSTIASTQMAGPPESMAQETAYFAALEQAATYTVTPESLEFLDGDGQVLVRFDAVEPVSLTGTEWQATAYNNGKGSLQSLAADSTITAVFTDDGTLSGNAGVNQYNTTYTASDEDVMSVDAQIVTTKMAGPEELMAQEAAYLAALPQTATYTINDSELWLRDADGAALAHYVAR